MATIVGEAFVAVTVEALLQSIVSGDFVDFFRSTKLDDSLLMRLNTTLLCLQALLNDAEEKQIKNDAVKQWQVLLQDAVFEAEDLFDEINTEALRCKVEAGKTVSAKVLLSSGVEKKCFLIPTSLGFKGHHLSEEHSKRTENANIRQEG